MVVHVCIVDFVVSADTSEIRAVMCCRVWSAGLVVLATNLCS